VPPDWSDVRAPNMPKRSSSDEDMAAPGGSAPDPSTVERFLTACAAPDAAIVVTTVDDQPELATAVHPANGWSSLHAAARSGSLEIVQALLSARADVHIQAHDGSSPLHVAACNASAGRQGEVAKLLIETGCPLESRDAQGRTALLLASQGGADSIAAALLAARADPMAADVAGRTCAMHAAERGHQGIASLLMMFGAR
jgi:ankyrin repeat protein